MGDWHKVERKPYSPCDGCEMGFCSYSQKEVDGELYVKTDNCHETCERVKRISIRADSHRKYSKAWQKLGAQ